MPFVREHLIGIQVEQNSKPLSDDRRQKILINCERAKTLMTNLRNRGASVVMFDSPVEAVVADSPYVAAVSETIHRYFTSTDFALLSNPPGNWQTRDGTHLMPESGKLYSIWLRKEIEALVAKGSPR
jgi:hypothetical protein